MGVFFLAIKRVNIKGQMRVRVPRRRILGGFSITSTSVGPEEGKDFRDSRNLNRFKCKERCKP